MAGRGVFAVKDFERSRASKIWDTLSRLGLARQDGDLVLASFPTQLIVNADTISHDGQVGSILKHHLLRDNLDHVGILQVWLILQRELGNQSDYSPYINSLPKPDIPIVYTDELLKELSGTEVYEAVHDLRLKLRSTWSNAQPILHEVGKACGRDFSHLSGDDWLWAFSIVTSRAFTVPQNSGSPDSTVFSLIPGGCSYFTGAAAGAFGEVVTASSCPVTPNTGSL